MNYKEEDINKYIKLYLDNRKMGLDLSGVALLAHGYFEMRDSLIRMAHNYDVLPFDPSEMINDYTMHLLTIFFIFNSSNKMFTYVGENFIKEYVKNESEIEGVNDLSIHGIEEMKGLEAMYKYINSGENEYSTGSMILTDLHEKLFSFVNDGEYSRRYRTAPAYLPCSGVELEESYMIPRAMRTSERLFDELFEESERMYNSEMEDKIHMVNPFLAKLMKYNAELVRIHPFPDGNGRSIRGLINFLLERAGLPPVYVKAAERGKYHEAMNKAIVEDDYTKLINFYKNKLCYSIEELVIEPFVYALKEYDLRKEEEESKKQKGSNLLRVLKNEEKPKE